MSRLFPTAPRRAILYLYINNNSATILLSVLTVLYLVSGFLSPTMDSTRLSNMFTYQIVPGYFLQEDPTTQPVSPNKSTPTYFDYTTHNFGLIDRPYPSEALPPNPKPLTQWQRFTTFLRTLPSTSPPGTSYKLFYLARHGQGYHNVAEAFYGKEAWDAHWSSLEGNGTMTWDDALLTSLGEEQAREAGRFLERQLGEGVVMPGPGEWVVSPLRRCLGTAGLTWGGLGLEGRGGKGEMGFRPVVREMVREVMGVHTCDRRSTSSVIRAMVPEWRIEEGFAEEDELWRADHREEWAEHDVRTRASLDEVFEREGGSDVVSVTAHSGTIASFLRVTGHREFPLPTGGMMPIFVKATRRT
ncbi:putative phosphoglycerate mutase pmu1 [Friedmanniomyces endolithicus]|uniref:Phosphoglycerate mutase pmu1 n=1 Tax=Friedmanniomyces endolithicus TaxID=329885 RepID=A0AAN6FVI3_9PEZI|nr:putative phosphoglycerate mutase pmu1 [Friedmanniomyces endolithicus]KAK0300117.1 putative phosphoglycerate mutase pmu1 [Friedmanniomyces endolithicus]KAK0325080.1 putative phosphoglycerate mutase pmu1 [Friedmanniomyces endolithicus]KAK0927798.1 putative phosphoglycerate mutase pmu1 [Friedmanniomyces endolithicus]KAK0999422.1 putative phosphoglycerate mutase pmu1 [Friedmanniomyces endolithicus]